MALGGADTVYKGLGFRVVCVCVCVVSVGVCVCVEFKGLGPGLRKPAKNSTPKLKIVRALTPAIRNEPEITNLIQLW